MIAVPELLIHRDMLKLDVNFKHDLLRALYSFVFFFFFFKNWFITFNRVEKASVLVVISRNDRILLWTIDKRQFKIIKDQVFII